MAHQQVKEEMRALIRLIRREMYPLFNSKTSSGHPNFDDMRRAGGMMRAHDIVITRYMQILKNEERDRTPEELDLLCVITERDIMREFDEGRETL